MRPGAGLSVPKRKGQSTTYHLAVRTLERDPLVHRLAVTASRRSAAGAPHRAFTIRTALDPLLLGHPGLAEAGEVGGFPQGAGLQHPEKSSGQLSNAC